MLTRVLLALVSLTSASVIADTPVPFGVRVQPLASMPTDPAPAQIDADLLANVDAAEQAVISMEQRLGPYHPDLTAPWSTRHIWRPSPVRSLWRIALRQGPA